MTHRHVRTWMNSLPIKPKAFATRTLLLIVLAAVCQERKPFGLLSLPLPDELVAPFSAIRYCSYSPV